MQRKRAPRVKGLDWGSGRQSAPLPWLWVGRIQAGALTVLEGRKGTGKSSVCSAICAAIQGKATLPDWVKTSGKNAIWESREESWEATVIPRLAACGGEPSRCGRIMIPIPGSGKSRHISLPGDTPFLREVIHAGNVGLLVLDPFGSCAAPTIDLRVEQHVRQYLEPLAEVASETGCAMVLIRHLRKGSSGDAREHGLGSVAVGNVARTVLRCDEHPHERGQRVLSVVSSNNGSVPTTLTYRIEERKGYPVVVWTGESQLTAEQIAEGRASTAERDEYSDAEKLLAMLIGQEWTSAGAIIAECRSAQVSERTIRRAKSTLGIPSRRVAYGSDALWEWGPPVGGWPQGLVDQDE